MNFVIDNGLCIAALAFYVAIHLIEGGTHRPGCTWRRNQRKPEGTAAANGLSQPNPTPAKPGIRLWV